MKRQIIAVVLAAATGVVGFSPAAAYAADTTTALTPDEMVAAVTAISTATKAASPAGWAADGKFPDTSWAKIVVDTPHGLGSERYNNGDQINEKILVDHQGAYDAIGTASQRAALKMIGRPEVRYVYAADTSIDLSGGPLGPETKDELGGAGGSKVSHDDGTTDYICAVAAGLTQTWRVDAAGVLVSYEQAGTTGETPETYVTYVTYTYRYGTQTVTRPTAAQTISANGLRRATAAYQMPSKVKKVAALVAAAGRARAGSRAAKVTAVRSQARKHAESLGREDGGTNIIKVTNVSNGVRVYGTNPYTHQKVSYHVTVSRSKKISVKQG